MDNPKFDKSKVDVSQTFLTFMALVGDVEKTAHALNMNPDVVRALAKDEGWLDKVRRISLLSRGGNPGDFERAQNRALNFVQSHRLRTVIDALIHAFDDQTPEQIIDRLTTVDRNGEKHYSARFIADLAAASEKVQGLSYAALGDSVKERVERASESEGALSLAGLHSAVIAALNDPGAPKEAVKLLDIEASNICRHPEVERSGFDAAPSPPVERSES